MVHRSCTLTASSGESGAHALADALRRRRVAFSDSFFLFLAQPADFHVSDLPMAVSQSVPARIWRIAPR